MSELENKIVELRKEGNSYASIQLKLGNPSKKFIKTTLKKQKILKKKRYKNGRGLPKDAVTYQPCHELKK